MAIRNFLSDAPAVQIADPIQQFAKVQGARNLIQQGQQNEQELAINDQRLAQNTTAAEKAKRIEDDTRTFGEVYLAAKGNPDETVRLAAERGIHPDLIQSFQQHNAKLAETAARTDAALLPIKKQKLEQAQGMLMEVEGMAPEALVQAWPMLYQKALQLDPEAKDYLSPMQPPNAQQFAALNAAVATQDYHLKKESEKRLTATAAQQATAATDIHTQKGAELPGIVSKTQTGVALDRATLANPNLLNPGQQAQARVAEGAATERAMTLGERRRHNQAMEAHAAAAKPEKPPTEAQSKVAGYAARIKSAGEDLDRLTGELGDVERGWNAITPDFLNTDTGKSFDRAQRDVINAVLRRESGAAIHKTEFDNAYKQYIPVAGDSKARIAEKKKNRDIVLGNYMKTAGAAYEDPDELIKRTQPASGGGGQQSGRKVGDVVNIGGKRVKIKALHGDGSFDGDEVQ